MWSAGLLPTFRADELFYAENGGNIFLQNISNNLTGYMTSYHRRQLSSFPINCSELTVLDSLLHCYKFTVFKNESYQLDINY
jgi:hypothetical protein